MGYRHHQEHYKRSFAKSNFWQKKYGNNIFLSNSFDENYKRDMTIDPDHIGMIFPPSPQKKNKYVHIYIYVLYHEHHTIMIPILILYYCQIK